MKTVEQHVAEMKNEIRLYLIEHGSAHPQTLANDFMMRWLAELRVRFEELDGALTVAPEIKIEDEGSESSDEGQGQEDRGQDTAGNKDNLQPKPANKARSRSK